MKKEIGGYLEFERYSGKEFYSDLIALNTARNALAYLVKSLEIKKVYVPYFLCNSIQNVCLRENIPFAKYHINSSFLPEFDKNQLADNEYLYVVNYYGLISDRKIKNLKKTYSNIIVDNVQAFFRKPLEKIPAIYSCRKFFGVPDGAYVYSPGGKTLTLEQDYSFDRLKHLAGRFEKNASDFYEDFKINDESFEKLPLKTMSVLTENILKSLDYKTIQHRRTENFKFLNKNLKNINELKLPVITGAYSYPLLLENGSEIRKRLQQKKIYIPTLWPDVLETCDETSVEYNFAKNILPIPCDQRYGKEEMKYILKEIFK